ncbi:unnamed protein product [Symbiodinium natans]|uniref:Uncharacterized protein n=1 Tax=Symbiodinium natans TaxID=878477 RepID=A0A812UW63_9DINO|nr:unnamed protein product [Symbiodinium natans]
MLLNNASSAGSTNLACQEALPYLECSGTEFDARWTELRLASIVHREAGLRWQDEGGDGARKIFDLSTFLVGTWWQQLSMAPITFDLVMKRLQPPSSLGGLCFYGLVTAIFLRSQFLSENLGHHQEALDGLQDGLSLLGARLHLDFVREASSWPFGALDFRVNRDNLQTWVGREQGKRTDGPASFRTSPFTGLQEPRPRLVARTQASWRRLESPGWRREKRVLGLAVFGVHSTLVLEPATMLKAALRPWTTRVQIFMRDCPRGNAAWSHHCALQCQALGSCEPGSEGSSQLWVDLVHMFEEAIHERQRYYQVADYLTVLAEMHRLDAELRGAEMYVCTAPLVCSLLRTVVEKPLLAYLGMQLHVNVDRQTDQLWLMHFQAMTRDREGNVWAAHNFALREQIRYATGVQLEVVRPRALYVQRPSKLYRTSPGKAYRRQVLFFRSSYFQLSLFLPVLEAHLDACGSQLPLALRVVRSSGDFVPFRQMAQFKAAVLFPWDPALMAFYELYSLGPALLLPRSAWIFKIQHLRARCR